MIWKRRQPREECTEFGHADVLESEPGVAQIRYLPELTAQVVNRSIDHDGHGVSHFNFETGVLLSIQPVTNNAYYHA